MITNQPLKKVRDTHLDSLKFLLVFLVVFGHTLQYAYGEDSLLRSHLYIFIYEFHMPLFIFISGYLSKGLTFRKFKKSLPSLLAAYLIFQTILSLPDLIAGSVHPAFFVLKPTGVMWYIACLIVWRFLFSILPKSTKLAPLAIIISFILSFSAGFFLNGNMTARALTFLPYFTIGYYCTTEIINKIRGFNKVIATLFILLLFFATYEFTPKAFIYSLYGDVLYSNFMVSDNLFSVTTIGAAFRIISYGLAISMCCAVCNPRLFCSIWRQNTVYISTTCCHCLFRILYSFKLLQYPLLCYYALCCNNIYCMVDINAFETKNHTMDCRPC